MISSYKTGIIPNSTFPFQPRYPSIEYTVDLHNDICPLFDSIGVNYKYVINGNIIVKVMKSYSYMQIFFVADIYKRKSIFVKLKYFICLYLYQCKHRRYDWKHHRYNWVTWL